jgi:hypothetical protein
MRHQQIWFGAIVIAALALAGCASTSTSSSSTSAAPAHSTAAAPSASSSGYPQEAADKALCTTYQSLSQNGDLAGIPVAVASADGSVTQNLTDVMSRQATTLQQDEQNDVLVAENCALVSVGKPPTISHN